MGIFLCIFVKKKLMSAISEVQGTTAGVGVLGVMVRVQPCSVLTTCPSDGSWALMVPGFACL